MSYCYDYSKSWFPGRVFLQSAVGGAGSDAAGAPGRGGALHPALHQERVEEQLPAGVSGRRAPSAGLHRLHPGRPQHHGPVSEQRHRQAAAAPATRQNCESTNQL